MSRAVPNRLLRRSPLALLAGAVACALVAALLAPSAGAHVGAAAHDHQAADHDHSAPGHTHDAPAAAGEARRGQARRKARGEGRAGHAPAPSRRR